MSNQITQQRAAKQGTRIRVAVEVTVKVRSPVIETANNSVSAY
jgi:hypothetical protein